MNKLKVKDLKLNSKKVNIEVEIVEIEEPPRDFQRDDRNGKVADGLVKDSENNKIKMSFFNEETKFKVGDRIMIQNGYVYSYSGELVLSAGKYGKITFISKNRNI